MRSNLSALPIAETFAAIADSLSGSRQSGRRDVVLGQLDAISRTALGDVDGDGFMDRMVATIRVQGSTSEKSRMAATASLCASRLGDHGLARKLQNRALNYAASLEGPEARIEEIVGTVDRLASDSHDTDALRDSLHEAADAVASVEDETKRTALTIAVAKAYGRLNQPVRAADILSATFGADEEEASQAPEEVTEAVEEVEEIETVEEPVAAVEDATPEVVEEVLEVPAEPKEAPPEPATKAKSKPPIGPPPAVAGPQSSTPNEGISEGNFVDPAAGIVFPTRRRSRR